MTMISKNDRRPKLGLNYGGSPVRISRHIPASTLSRAELKDIVAAQLG